MIAATPPASADVDDFPERWQEVVACESGGDLDAVNPASGASGAWQFMPSTWAAYAPAGYPDSPLGATLQQQLVVAERVLAAQGSSAWVCDGAPSSASSVEYQPAPQPQPGGGSGYSPPCTEAKLGWEACDPGDLTHEPEPTPEPEPVSQPSGNATYTVRSGDTLSQIAAAHGTTWQHLFREMPQPGLGPNPNRIYPGDRVNVTGHQ